MFFSETGTVPKALQTVLLELYHGAVDIGYGTGSHFTNMADSQVPALSPIKSPKRQSRTEKTHNAQQTCIQFRFHTGSVI